jgi:aldose 1-epimerase
MKSLNTILFILMILATQTGCREYQTQQSTEDRDDMKPELTIEKEIFGKIDDQAVYLFTLRNANGMLIKITNFGGIITQLHTSDRNGKIEDIVLGFDSLSHYIAEHPYFGAIVGRYANRIALGEFSIDGQTYKLARNNGQNALHGGVSGFDKKIWEVTEYAGKDEIGVTLVYVSPDGEEGYPGELKVAVKYTLNMDNELKIHYRAETDKPTPVNLTHHSYFNLRGAGNGNILDHQLYLDAGYFTPVGEDLIPTGDLQPVGGTPFDFRNPFVIGARIDQVPGGYDHNFVLNNENQLKLVARVTEPQSGRTMQVLTDQPGMQFYTGNFLDGSVTGKGGKRYEKHTGFCLETQHFPDSPNQPGFPNTILKPGEVFESTTIYIFGTMN